MKGSVKMNDVVDYKAEFEKAQQAVVIMQKQLSEKTKIIDSLQNSNIDLKTRCERLKEENMALKNAIIEKYLNVDLKGDDNV
jgi:cell division protein FtsB